MNDEEGNSVRSKTLKITQTTWLTLICLYTIKVIPTGGNTASIMMFFAAAYFFSTIGLFFDLRIAWIISVLPPLLISLLSGVWFLLNMGTFITGLELYHDSPATIIVVFLGASFTLLPSVILLILFWRDRKFLLINRRSKVSQSNQEDAPGVEAPR